MQNQTTGLSATGVPPHLTLANELVDLKENLTPREAQFGELVAALPAKVTTAVLAECEVNGAVPLTAASVNALMATLQSTLLERIEELGPRASIANAGNNGVTVELYGCTYKYWEWGGKFRVVPEGWGFPSGIATNTLWDLWLDGDKRMGIRPYEVVSKNSGDVKKSTTIKMSKAKTVMKCIIDRTGKSIADIHALSIVQRDELFAHTFSELCVVLFPDKPAAFFLNPKAQALSYTRVYDLIRSAKKTGGFRIKVCKFPNYKSLRSSH